MSASSSVSPNACPDRFDLDRQLLVARASAAARSPGAPSTGRCRGSARAAPRTGGTPRAAIELPVVVLHPDEQLVAARSRRSACRGRAGRTRTKRSSRSAVGDALVPRARACASPPRAGRPVWYTCSRLRPCAFASYIARSAFASSSSDVVPCVGIQHDAHARADADERARRTCRCTRVHRGEDARRGRGRFLLVASPGSGRANSSPPSRASTFDSRTCLRSCSATRDEDLVARRGARGCR